MGDGVDESCVKYCTEFGLVKALTALPVLLGERQAGGNCTGALAGSSATEAASASAPSALELPPAAAAATATAATSAAAVLESAVSRLRSRRSCP
jgi:hypothetical protein